MTNPTPKLTALIQAEPDLVDRIFDYILSELPEVAASVAKHKAAVRAEYGGQKWYIARKPPDVRQQITKNIRSQFNGVTSNSAHIKMVAMAEGVSRATVYRAIQPTNSKAK